MWINRHILFTKAILIFFSALVLLYVGVMPIYRNVSLLTKKIENKSSELDAATEKVAILSKLDPVVLAERVKVIDRALPPKKDVLLYLNSIEGLSRELNLIFSGLSLSPGEITEASGAAKPVAKKPPTKKVALETLDTVIKVTGGQNSIYAFLRTIEEVLPLMQIKDVKVSIINGDQFSLTLTLGMLWADPVTTDVKGPVTLFGDEENKYFGMLSSYKTYESIGFATTPTTEGKQDLFAPFALPDPVILNVVEEASTSSEPILLQ